MIIIMIIIIFIYKLCLILPLQIEMAEQLIIDPNLKILSLLQYINSMFSNPKRMIEPSDMHLQPAFLQHFTIIHYFHFA